MKKQQVINRIKDSELNDWNDGPYVLLLRDELGHTYAIKKYTNPLGIVACVYKADKTRVLPNRIYFINKRALQTH